MYEIIAIFENGVKGIITNVVADKREVFILEFKPLNSPYEEERDLFKFNSSCETLVMMHKLLELIILRDENMKKKGTPLYPPKIASLSYNIIPNVFRPFSSFDKYINDFNMYDKLLLHIKGFQFHEIEI